MPRICYDTEIRDRLRKNPKHLEVIAKANEIIAAYEAQGFDLTLRQLYYQFVSRDLIPNKDTEYKRLGSIISDARMAGLIDWESITDRTRYLRALAHWDSPADIIEGASQQFRYDRWEDQPVRVEVWIEKDALVGVIGGVCESLDVPYFSCRGYTSISEVWVAAQRLRAHTKAGQQAIILHFGDHDPSGIDMTRDIRDRLRTFGVRLDLRRLALNMDQVEKYNPPPNPAKLTDSRCAGYMQVHGDESWELDALEPSVIAGLISREVESLRDEAKWDAASVRQDKARALLSKVSEQWDDITDRLEDETDE